MYLKRLELSGFKSFAKTTALSFPSRVTAIVGPNGSGKSNITEAIRWVLGEQSIKTLRGKRGEDLIWNGSAEHEGRGLAGVPRMGKAAVSLVLDNADAAIPIDFAEVTLTRKIFRDGANEYFINNSAVRLKDVVELIARMGLGEQKHNIIGQGEVDRLLLSTPRERYQMLEEALGLRVWQLKKNEAERKLDATRRTMEQVEGRIRELAPHLKFLRLQAKRAEASSKIAEELARAERVWGFREADAIERAEQDLAARMLPLTDRDALLRQESAAITREIAEGEFSFKKASRDIRLDAVLAERRRTLERELGRLEGRLEGMPEREEEQAPGRVADLARVSDEIRAVLKEIKPFLQEDRALAAARGRILLLVADIERLLDAALKGHPLPRRGIMGEGTAPQKRKIEQAIRNLQKDLEETGKEIAAAEEEMQKEITATRATHAHLRALDRDLRKKQDEARIVALERERLAFESARVRDRREAFRREIGGAQTPALLKSAGVLEMAEYEHMPQEELYKKIERLRIRLEEAGGIDQAVIKEYEDTEARQDFLTREREDVVAAALSLGALIKELDRRITADFKEGFAKIKDEFHRYFRIVFGGGSGRLSIIQREPRIKGEEGEEASGETAEEAEEGIEIEVDLPRKRIHGLAMLSGGERALTAIALLFAITAVNPPPFLILDETDAALDEANSQRYTAILKELATHTQLVVVTHNRETMKGAGVLYGVTMGDDGVSRLLSLKLEEAEEYTNR